MGLRRDRLRPLHVGLIALVAVAATVVVGESTSGATTPDDPEEVNELTVGDWSGIGVASGVAWANQGGFQLLWVAGFENRFHFTVTESDVVGTFTLTSGGMYGNDQMAMRFQGPNIDATANWNISPPAQGTIDGDRSLLVFNAGNVTTAGTMNIPGVGSVPVSGQPSDVSITNSIKRLTCDTAEGDWEISVIQQIEGQGWSPSWNGSWVAFPVPDPDQQTEAEDLVDGLDELFNDFNEFSATASNALDPEAPYEPTNIDRAELIDLANRATEMANKLHNLSPCDQEQIGADTLREWNTALVRGVADLAIAAAEYVAAQGDTVIFTFETLNALVAAADATGAHGEGSGLGAGEAFQLEDALSFLTGASVEQHLRFAEGRYSDCDSACQLDNYLWAAGSVAEAVTHGWSITVEGQTYGPSEAPQLLANPPGESE
jgi:hypothetical protein